MNTPDLRQLRYFVAVAEELHFGRAAERLGMAQPPLTLQVQKLEKLLGCQVFVRGRSTALTPAGVTLLGEARRILDHAERGFEATRRAARGDTGTLTIGLPPSVMLTNVPSAIRKYRERYPDVGFTLREMSTAAAEEGVRAGDLDLALLREATPGAPLQSTVVFTEPVVVILPRTRDFGPGLRSLRSEPFVLFPRRLGPALHDHLTSFCARAGFIPNIVQEATQWQTVISLVEAGMGVSLAPACVRKFRWRGVVYRPVPGATTSVAACWREKRLSPAAEQFLKLVPSLKTRTTHLRAVRSGNMKN